MVSTADRATHDDTIPVTVLSGSLGAGKTTLLNHVLNDRRGPDIAAIVNDMGAVNIDADLLSRNAETAEDGIVDLSNGCICCRLQDDLLTEAKRLAETRSFEYLVVESSGISDPVPVARTFAVGTDGSDIDPTAHYRLDTMVAVVDTYGFWKEFDAGATLPETAEPDADRPLADVLVGSIEFCDVALLNKCDMVPADELDRIEAVVRRLQPRAELVRTTYCDIDPGLVLGTGRFDFEAATRGAGWKRALAEEGQAEAGDHDHAEGTHGHDHAADEHGVSSFVYARKQPFHPRRLDDWLDAWPDGVVRAKGYFELAGRETDVMGLSQAGPSVQAGPIGQWNTDDERRTRLVFIGSGMNEKEIVRELDDCLATDDERDADSLDDPFPA